MSIENDSAPAAPADQAEMPQEATAPMAGAHDAAPAEAGNVMQPTGASPETATEPEAEEPAEQVSEEVSEKVTDAALEPVASGAEEGAEPERAPVKSDLSPAQCAARLAEMFPALFGMEGPPKPIKLRIQADIQERAPGLFTRKALSIVLHRHTTTTPYLKALLAAPSRFDLDGQPAGDIAEEHRQAAREEVERRRAIVAARRAAESQARNPRGPRPAPTQVPGGARTDGMPDRAAPTGTSEAAMPTGTPAPMAPARRERGPRQGAGAPGARPPRRPQEFREPRGGREGGEAREAHAQREQRDAREPRPPRPAWPAGNRPNRHGASAASAPQRDARPPRPDSRFDASRDTAGSRPALEAQAHNALPEDPARRERALLLRTYEASSLTKANFCVLKRITEAELDAQLEQARQERGPVRPRS